MCVLIGLLYPFLHTGTQRQNLLYIIPNRTYCTLLSVSTYRYSAHDQKNDENHVASSLYCKRSLKHKIENTMNKKGTENKMTVAFFVRFYKRVLIEGHATLEDSDDYKM